MATTWLNLITMGCCAAVTPANDRTLAATAATTKSNLMNSSSTILVNGADRSWTAVDDGVRAMYVVTTGLRPLHGSSVRGSVAPRLMPINLAALLDANRPRSRGRPAAHGR